MSLLLAFLLALQDLDAEGFVRAGPGRALVLPADHGCHPETRTEWWYLSGHLVGPAGESFGFQATWFRQALLAELPPGRSPLAVRDALAFHGVLSDVGAGRLHATERLSRAYPPWAHAAEGRLDLDLLGERLVAEADGGSAALDVRAGDARLRLALDLAASEPLLHGALPGLSVKGHEPGQASWYASLPRIPVRGELLRDGAPPLPVTGLAWFDHEFGSGQLDETQVGWDWFSVALDDGSDLMLYALRLADGARDTTSAGTLRAPDGARRHLGHDDFTLVASETWTSPATGTTYPSRWEIAVPDDELVLVVTPAFAAQELRTPGSTDVTYWEGLCRFEGTRAGRAVQGWGYVELVGYDRAFRRRI